LHRAVVRTIRTNQAAQQRRLACTIAACQCNRLTCAHLEIEAIEDRVGAESPAKSRDLQDGRAFGHVGILPVVPSRPDRSAEFRQTQSEPVPLDLEPRRCTLSPEERAQSRPTGL